MIALNCIGGRYRFALAWIVGLGAFAEVTLAPPPPGGGSGNGNGGGNGNGNGQEPDIELTGIVHDFLPTHPDFDVVPPSGFGQYMWNIATGLDPGNKPMFIGGGFKVVSQAHDVSGRQISWTLFNAALGDTQAVQGNPDNGGITSAETFSEWFRDIPGTNMSTLVTVSGNVTTGGPFDGMYEINIPQFYPIDDILLGNDGDHNNFFTFEIDADFVYDAEANQTLYLLTDDDTWVFVEDQLVGDLGGINGATEQWMDMDRLGLTDGQTYLVRIFKADRSDASSRFHLVTNIPLNSIVPSTILALFD